MEAIAEDVAFSGAGVPGSRELLMRVLGTELGPLESSDAR